MSGRLVYCWDHGRMPTAKLGPVSLASIRRQLPPGADEPRFGGRDLEQIESAREALCLVHANDAEWRHLRQRAESLSRQGSAIFIRVSFVSLEPVEHRVVATETGAVLCFLELPDSHRLNDAKQLSALLNLTADEASTRVENQVALSPQLEAVFKESGIPELVTSLKLLHAATRDALTAKAGVAPLGRLWRNALPLDWESRLRRELAGYLSEAERRAVEPLIQAIPPVLSKDATRENFQHLHEAVADCIW